MADEIKKYEESQYTIDLVLPGIVGETVTATVVTRERPFAMTMITHCVVGDAPDPAAGFQMDPEQYSIDWSISNEKRYWKGGSAPMAKSAFGSVHTGQWISFPQPVAIEAKTTLYVTLMNRYAAPGNSRKIQVILHGVERIFD
jgi:hypothetical protein